MKTMNDLLRTLPKVDDCLLRMRSYAEKRNIPQRLVKKAIQHVVERNRQAILDGVASRLPGDDDSWDALFAAEMERLVRPHFRRVINGTGVVIHTNLGRSLLSRKATEQLLMASEYYTNLEFDLASGTRGSRYALVEDLICDLTGAEAALVVNNNAAAVLISLETLAKGREVIVSRGQLVEIGGSFRIPDVMAKSGAQLVEVGATNRTHLYDFEQAITEETAMLLRVHTSNFRMVGFTSQVEAAELVGLGNKYGLMVMEDLGSGSFVDLSRFGLPNEPTVQEVLQSGVDVVTFSGDKLLGGPQAGIIVGRREVIGTIKKNPLNRAVRIDKFTLAALESVLRSYYDLERAVTETPTLRMIGEDSSIIRKRAKKLLRKVGTRIGSSCGVRAVPTVSRVGGGALPEYGLDSWALELAPRSVAVSKLERDFRALEVPVIGRIDRDRFLIDMRTVQDREVGELADILCAHFGSTD